MSAAPGVKAAPDGLLRANPWGSKASDRNLTRIAKSLPAKPAAAHSRAARPRRQ